MGSFTFQSVSRPEPLLISVKKDGDSRERFLSRAGATINFDEDTGDGSYTSVITDSNGNSSTERFIVTCQRPADCQEGPDGIVILSKNALEIKYQFHGVNVARIRRSILKNGAIVDQKVDIPSSSIITSGFASALDPGQYVLRIEGDSCFSQPQDVPFEVIGNGATPLAWTPGYPSSRLLPDQIDIRQILLSINKTIQSAYYSIKNKATGATLIAQEHDFNAGGVLPVDSFGPGTYAITVSTLYGEVIIPEAPEEPEDNQCQAGPSLLNVISLNLTQTRFQFDGLGVSAIEAIIKQNGTIKYSNIINPQSSLVTLDHNYFTPGTYNLQIKGANCTSEPGVIDDIDYEVGGGTGGGAVDLTNVGVTQLDDGRYRLAVTFNGGRGSYTIIVRGQANNTIAQFPNTTGSPSTVTLPYGVAPQTVKVAVVDADFLRDEITNVVLPPAVPKLTFLQADNFFTPLTRTAMNADGATYTPSASSTFNWDIEFAFPNGGLWDYIEKRFRKLVNGSYVEKSVSAATGNAQNYAVASSINTERIFLPRNGQTLTIDGQNVFKTGATWEVRFIARKGGASGAVVGQITRTFTIAGATGGGTPSGIYLHNRAGSTVGSMITEIPISGGSYAKPTPYYDLVVLNYGGVSFNRQEIRFKLQSGTTFTEQMYNSFDFGSLRTSLLPQDHSIFWHPESLWANFVATAKPSLFAQANQTWRIEFTAYNGSTVVGTKSAVFNFTASGAV